MNQLNNHKDLKEFIESFEKVVIKFYAEWCGPCRAIANKYQSSSESYPDIKFAQFDMDGKDDVAVKYKVDALPTFLFYHKGKPIGKVFGAKQEKMDEQIQILSTM